MRRRLPVDPLRSSARVGARSPRGLALVVLLLAGAACTHRLAAQGPRAGPLPATPAPPPPGYYEAGGPVPAPLSVTREKTGRGWVRDVVMLPPRVPPELREIPRAADPIEIVHYRPRARGRTRHGAIVASPILGGSRLLVDLFAKRFANAGFHVALVQRKELAFDPRASFRLAEAESRLLVMRSRQVVDWLLEREDVDPERLGTFGVSAGAIVSSMVAGADPRLETHVWMLGGGPLADVMGDTEEGRFVRYRAATTAATGLSEAQVRAHLRRTLRTDPIVLAPRVRREGVLLVLADRDRSVPTRWGRRLWEALGRPELRTTPFGHHSSFVFLPWLMDVATGWFEGHMAPAGGGSPGPASTR